MRGFKEIADFCTGKTVVAVWSDSKSCDEDQNVAQFFDDGSILEIVFVQDYSEEPAMLYFFGHLPDEVGRL